MWLSTWKLLVSSVPKNRVLFKEEAVGKVSKFKSQFVLVSFIGVCQITNTKIQRQAQFGKEKL